MAIASAVEIGQGLRGGRLTDEFERTYSRFWRVRTTANTDGPKLVATAAGIPAMWAAHPEDSGALVNAVIAKEQHDSPRHWIVEVQYSTRASDEDLQDIDPTLEPAQFSQDTEFMELALQTDLDSAAIVNSAHDPFDPPPTEIWPVLVIQYSDNLAEADTHYADVNDYLNHCNAATFWSQDAKNVLIKKFSHQRMFRNDVAYQQRRLELHILSDELVTRMGDWTQLKVLDAGFRIITDADGNPLTGPVSAGFNGEVTSRPALLNAIGGRLPTGSSPEYITFRVRDTADFSALSLETPPL